MSRKRIVFKLENKRGGKSDQTITTVGKRGIRFKKQSCNIPTEVHYSKDMALLLLSYLQQLLFHY